VSATSTVVFEGLERRDLRDHAVAVLFDGERLPATE